MSDWTNIKEIMEDLSVAQGSMVPACLETYGAVGPPAFNVEEESEEQSYYESAALAGGDSAAPDYGLIQELLNRVKKDSKESDQVASELDPLSREFIPQRIKNKIHRNVAIASIITAKEAENSAKRPIPKDVIPTMFKRKSANSTEVKSDTMSPPQILSPNKYNQYIPTSRANEYYTKYLEKSKLKEQIEDDIWSKAERQMKEIEARKKRATQIVSPQDRGNDTCHSSTVCGFDAVNLSQHRHQFSGDCIVCIVASKHGYFF